MGDRPRAHTVAGGKPWNVVVVMSDTLRTAYISPYGNDWVRTPNFERFARQATKFTRAHPESLPTIPTRRTLHTGRRAYPFNDYNPVPWDNVYLPGWQPMSPDEGTIAEALERAGHQTGFVSDCPHYFVPGMNFTRGFRQWQFTRGQAEDRWNSPAAADEARVPAYRGNPKRIRAHLVNVRPEQPEEHWPTARTFRWAMRFLEQNSGNTPFYLYVDTFSPHETWEAPLHYYALYGSREEREPLWLTVPYASLDDHPEVEASLASIRANYAGLVTMVDCWFGRLLDTLDRLALSENTLVILISDHGTNFGENPQRFVGKPESGLYPGTMDIPLLMRVPGREAAVCDELVYSLDVPATIMAVAGVEAVGELQGRNLLTIPGGSWQSREYLTCRYGNYVWYRDEKTWYFSTAEFADTHLFDLETDPACRENIAGRAPDRSAKARDGILADAGGQLVSYRRREETDALGRPVFG
jgi:arylsulfatase A-like enzyme